MQEDISKDSVKKQHEKMAMENHFGISNLFRSTLKFDLFFAFLL